MRRENYEIFFKYSLLGLLKDCAHYCWQNNQISNEELFKLDCFIDRIQSFKIDERIKEN